MMPRKIMTGFVAIKSFGKRRLLGGVPADMVSGVIIYLHILKNECCAYKNSSIDTKFVG